MKLLVDTHALLWFLEGSEQLSELSKSRLSDPNVTKIISIASLWEIAIKSSIGKLTLPFSFTKFSDELFSDSGLEMLDISVAHLSLVSELSFHHKDPFDRLIIAQGIVEGIPILTHDAHFRNYQIEVIW